MNEITNRRMFAAVFTFALTLGIGAIAHAEETDVTVVDAKFTDRVDQSKPVGDADAAARARVVTYWVEVGNKKAPSEITLVWKRDGKEVQRQHLDVGLSPRWRTWGMCPTAGAKEIEIDVIDASGHVLKSDTLSLK